MLKNDTFVKKRLASKYWYNTRTITKFIEGYYIAVEGIPRVWRDCSWYCFAGRAKSCILMRSVPAVYDYDISPDIQDPWCVCTGQVFPSLHAEQKPCPETSSSLPFGGSRRNGNCRISGTVSGHRTSPGCSTVRRQHQRQWYWEELPKPQWRP